MRKFLFCVCLFAFLLSSFFPVWASTDHNVPVMIANSTGKTILSVRLIHKYSDDITDEMEMGPIANGDKKAFDGRANYRTGFATTGRDWWFVSWVTKEDAETTKVWFIYPDNYRSILDYMEANVLPVVTNLIVSAAADKAIPAGDLDSSLDYTKSSLGKIGSFDVASMKEGFQEIWPAFKLEISQWGKKEGVAAAENAAAKKVTSAIASNLYNKGGTNGFKQHILTSADKPDGIIITLSSDKVIFYSNSGTSTTPAYDWQALKPKGITDVVYRNASVKVKNSTSHKLEKVLVGHKYSDLYLNAGFLSSINPGEVSENSFPVEFNTGKLTTGRDWWIVMWVFRDSNGNVKVYESHPDNLRGVVDWLENKGSWLLDKAISFGAKPAVDSGNPIAISLLALAVVTESMLNDATTDGFKQHILNYEDQFSGVTIEILDNHVKFSSASGESTTDVKEIDYDKLGSCANDLASKQTY